MDKEAFLNIFRDSIRAITNKRYFSTERGYQGQLVTELNSRHSGKAILEQEYQKTLRKHGVIIRPDIILHIPYEKRTYSNHRSGNFVVIQLKRNAYVDKAREDFDKIDLMFKHLDYPLGIFLNINSANTFFDCYTGDYPERLHCFAVIMVNHKVIIYE